MKIYSILFFIIGLIIQTYAQEVNGMNQLKNQKYLQTIVSSFESSFNAKNESRDTIKNSDTKERNTFNKTEKNINEEKQKRYSISFTPVRNKNNKIISENKKKKETVIKKKKKKKKSNTQQKKTTLKENKKKSPTEKNISSTYPSLIAKNWEVVTNEQVIESNSGRIKTKNHILSLNFQNNNTVEMPFGFRKTVDQNLQFFETKMDYTINGNQLTLKNKGNILYTFTIKSLTNNELILSSNDKIVTLKPTSLPTTYPNNFDQIIISEYASDNFIFDKTNIIISPNDFIYQDLKTNPKSKIKEAQFLTSNNPQEIFTDYQQKINLIDINQLQKSYNQYENTNDIADLQYSITIIQNGKILKTVIDNEFSGPKELIWLYQNAKNQNKKQPLTTYTLPKYGYIQNLDFRQGKKYTNLKQSESFYLWSLLKNGKIIKTPTTKLPYEVVFKDDTYQVTKIKTDGRYFQITLKDKSNISIDIQQNFLTQNSNFIQFN